MNHTKKSNASTPRTPPTIPPIAPDDRPDFLLVVVGSFEEMMESLDAVGDIDVVREVLEMVDDTLLDDDAEAEELATTDELDDEAAEDAEDAAGRAEELADEADDCCDDEEGLLVTELELDTAADVRAALDAAAAPDDII
ncbi:hypothetical protein QFC24_005206 [Naganishia onofrii]|uniref:Uncharacterized protein n=1 Tax=Naganishia onofrii TaxID=1851511 RepID=A0ACC2X921_9TREE|nr:hypothetical protein QFC24_005206 [Naganishia onofrii]